MIGKIVKFFVIVLLEGIVIGSVGWFFGNLFFDVTWEYFSYVRGWVIAFLIFDIVYELFRFGSKNL